jgi:hypothetical protein
MSDEILRQMPMNELDYNLQLTDPKWGQEMTREFMNRMGEKTKVDRIKILIETLMNDKTISEDTANIIFENILVILQDDKDSMWSMLAYYTRDLRLANLSAWDGELEYCEKHLNFAGDCLQFNLKKSFLITIKSAISKMEISQSKNGFLRKRMGTLTTENITNELEPKKKSFFGMSKKGD